MNVCEYSGQKWATTANNLRDRGRTGREEGGREGEIWACSKPFFALCFVALHCSNVAVEIYTYTCRYIHMYSVCVCACVYAWCLSNSAQKSNFTRIVSQICIFYLAPHFCLFARLPHIRIPCNHAMQGRGSFVNHTDKVAKKSNLRSAPFQILIFSDSSYKILWLTHSLRTHGQGKFDFSVEYHSELPHHLQSICEYITCLAVVEIYLLLFTIFAFFSQLFWLFQYLPFL